MSSHSEDLALRRAALQLRCAVQRRQLAEITGELEHSLSYVDRGFELVQRLRSAPVLLAAGVAAVVFFGPGRLMRWIGRGVLISTLVKRLTR